MTERNDEIKRPPVLSDDQIDAAWPNEVGEQFVDIRALGRELMRCAKIIAEAQRDADAKFYEGVMQRMIAQMRKVLKPVNQARRDTVYAVESFLEGHEIALFYTYMKGDERLVGDRANTDIIRRVLEEDE